ncbi:hypothetical protein KIN20_029511 [Parelaphostrongylus tenuis]|uniref:Uncharacterized protein n=1 Tax=Parelaphostrongylus tenuis TaxID=148309 RepID=A0AAD5R2K9_PARTN|nr:hypothetical protein KIN20_029511 [Parelaphostrongylus tenuis]
MSGVPQDKSHLDAHEPNITSQTGEPSSSTTPHFRIATEHATIFGMDYSVDVELEWSKGGSLAIPCRLT